MSVRQLFANLTPGKEKQEKERSKQKRHSGPFSRFGKNLYLSISFFDFPPAPLSLSLLHLLLLPHQLPSLFHPAGRNKRAPPPTPPPFLAVSIFWERELKLHSVASIVRVIRKSYLQRVWVARTETAVGRVADGAHVCACSEAQRFGWSGDFFFFLL